MFNSDGLFITSAWQHDPLMVVHVTDSLNFILFKTSKYKCIIITKLLNDYNHRPCNQLAQ